MRIVVTGATGTIGRTVVEALRARGDEVVALSREESRARERLGREVTVAEWAEPARQPPPRNALAGADAVVHLLGEPIDQRWTDEAKERIRESRVQSTARLVEGLHQLADGERPRVLVAESATGVYGARDGVPLDETAAPGDGFLAELALDWEREAAAAEPLLRVVRVRTGVVLSPSGGALARMLPFFRLGLGGPVAGGGQFVPWVHLDDVVAALLRCVDDERATGPVNVTAPDPVTNRELARALGRVLGRPAVLPVPGVALRLLYGDMAQLVTEGHRVVPRRLEALGHEFRPPELEPAVRDTLRDG
jgi:uncharacterized protein (TIGR01777 family)